MEIVTVSVKKLCWKDEAEGLVSIIAYRKIGNNNAV